MTHTDNLIGTRVVAKIRGEGKVRGILHEAREVDKEAGYDFSLVTARGNIWGVCENYVMPTYK